MKNFILTALSALLFTGCANAPPDDPLEPYNRAMFSFNENVDSAVLKPAAQAWTTVTPAPVRTWVSNFFGNLRDPWIGFNNLLQGKPADAMSDWMRFMVNSTLGIFGLLDIATEARMPKHDEDFGQTLAVWGVKDGTFIVLPFFGPRTLRDAVALPADLYGESPWALPTGKPLVSDAAGRYGLSGVRVVNERANLLGLERTLDEATLDKYRYARDFYLQQRRFKIYDGNPPLVDDGFDFDEEGVQQP